MSRLLVVEDEPRIASFVAKGLTAAGHVVTVVEDGAAALLTAHDTDFDLVVLDLGLPDLDGLEVLRRLRAAGQQLPVVVLTARDGVDDRVNGLDGGADDYLTKPFAVEELLARVRARLRPAAAQAEPVTRLRNGPVELDLLARRVTHRGAEVELTSREMLLLETFLRHPGQVLSREQLLSRVWGYDYDPGSNVVDVYVSYLRRKLSHEFLTTVRGVGYRCPP